MHERLKDALNHRRSCIHTPGGRGVVSFGGAVLEKPAQEERACAGEGCRRRLEERKNWGDSGELHVWWVRKTKPKPSKTRRMKSRMVVRKRTPQWHCPSTTCQLIR